MDIDEVVATPTADIANEVPAEDNPEEANASQDSKGSRSFTKEERATIIDLAKEVGATKVAREIGVSASLIYYWLHQEKKKSSAKSEQSSEQAVAQTHTEQTTNQTQATKRGSRRKKEVALKNMPTEATEPVKSVEPTEAKKTPEPKVPKAQKTVSINTLKSSGQRDENQALLIENAILKEKISTLTAEIEKLKSAMTSLM